MRSFPPDAGSQLLGNSAGLSRCEALFIGQSWGTVVVVVVYKVCSVNCICKVQSVFLCLDTTVSLFLPLPILMYITYLEVGVRLGMKIETVL